MRPEPRYDQKLKVVVVPGRPHTLKTLAEAIERARKAKGMTAYAVAKASGMKVSVNGATRMIKGYAATGQSMRDRVNNPDAAGRVRLETALFFVQALGYDLELVVRESPGRSDP
jgi:transcriptional regulator with XRE-family HTH domain